MTKPEFQHIVSAIKTYFPKDNMLPNVEAIELWYQELKDLSYQEAAAALHRYVAVGKFPPTIADIREQAALLRPDNELNELTAWGLVLKALQRSSYYAREEFEALPPTVRKVIGTPRQLREWATSEGTDISVIQSNFMRAYRTAAQEAREAARLSPQTRQAIDAAKSAPRLTTEKEH